jgi:hypothetical protein
MSLCTGSRGFPVMNSKGGYAQTCEQVLPVHRWIPAIPPVVCNVNSPLCNHKKALGSSFAKGKRSFVLWSISKGQHIQLPSP